MDGETERALAILNMRFGAALAMQRTYLTAMFVRLARNAPDFKPEGFIEDLYLLQQHLPDPRSGPAEDAGLEELKNLIETTEDTLQLVRNG
jgi:hypothetical protein